MQMRVISRTAAIIILAATTTMSYGQTSDDASTATSVTSSKKALRAQNHSLEKVVRRSFNKTRGLNGSGISVVVRGNNVTLEGSVPDASQIELAGNAASAAPGVSHVDNRITIREPGR